MSLFGWRSKKKPQDPNKEMSFLDHLEELRWHILRAMIAVIIAGSFIFVYRTTVMDDVVLGPYKKTFYTNIQLAKASVWFDEVTGGEEDSTKVKPEVVITAPDSASAEMDEFLDDLPGHEVGKPPFQSLTPYEQFLQALTIALVGGFVIAFPYVAFEIWLFIRPGLHPRERKKARGFVFFLSMLFFIGVSFGYYIVSPLAIQFLMNFTVSEMTVNQWQLKEAVMLVVRLGLAAGLLFQLPLVTFFLTRIGIINAAWMKAHRKHATVVLLLVSAVITPPDWITQVLIFLPLSLLYEISIWVARSVEKSEEKRRAEEKAEDEKRRAAAREEEKKNNPDSEKTESKSEETSPDAKEEAPEKDSDEENDEEDEGPDFDLRPPDNSQPFE